MSDRPPEQPPPGPPPSQPPPSQPPPGPPPSQPPSQPPPGPPGAGPPPESAPPPPPGSPSGGSRGLLIALLVVGVVALIALIVIGAVLVFGDDDDDDPVDSEPTSESASPTDATSASEPTDGSPAGGSEPEDVVEQAIALAQADDCPAAEELMTSEFAAESPCESPEWQMLASGEIDYEVRRTEIDDDGDEASVVVAFSDGTGSTDYEFDLDLVDSAWLIDDVEIDDH